MDNQNTRYKLLKQIKGWVLILVLMDNQNTTLKVEPLVMTLVLILVLMDNQNTAHAHTGNGNRTS